jgi:RNA polymerase sigma-70 factor (ECF subfamily)
MGRAAHFQFGTPEQGLVVTNWSSIVRSYGPVAFDTAWRLLGNVADAEDVVQETLLDAFRMHAREDIDNWGGLLRRLATRRAIDRLRRRRKSEVAPHEPLAGVSDQPESAAIERELADRLRRAIAELPDREASVFSLRYFGELTNPEIALALSISPTAVGVALHKARAKLKQMLKVENPAG